MQLFLLLTLGHERATFIAATTPGREALMTESTSYIEVQLYNSTTLFTEGTQSAYVTSVGVLIRGAYSDLAGSPRGKAQEITRRTIYTAHTALQQEELVGLATDPHEVRLFHCSLCGGQLSQDACVRCRASYGPFPIFSPCRQAALARTVLDCLKEQGHHFKIPHPRY